MIDEETTLAWDRWTDVVINSTDVSTQSWVLVSVKNMFLSCRFIVRSYFHTDEDPGLGQNNWQQHLSNDSMMLLRICMYAHVLTICQYDINCRAER